MAMPIEPFVIWIDADAAPGAVKDVVFKASKRLRIPVILVANHYVPVPPNSLFTSMQVQKGADVADFYIVERVTNKDLVITADIPLANLIVDKGAVAMSPRGDIYTKNNIKERLSSRNFMQELRDSGINTGGPASYSAKDKMHFANALDCTLTKMLKA